MSLGVFVEFSGVPTHPVVACGRGERMCLNHGSITAFLPQYERSVMNTQPPPPITITTALITIPLTGAIITLLLMERERELRGRSERERDGERERERRYSGAQ